MKGSGIRLIVLYGVILSCYLFVAMWGNEAITTLSESLPVEGRSCVIIDPGHGGVDGGATSVSGVLESRINLEISLRLNDLMHLLGYDTMMIRTEDISVYTQGETIAQKKISDLRNRVKTINSVENAIVISIHQNYYPEGKYNGAQVFYSNTSGSKDLAKLMQSELVRTINPGSGRKSKPANGIYLMEHIDCVGILLECGFISNSEEEAKLLSQAYQKRLCCVVSTTISNFLDG